MICTCQHTAKKITSGLFSSSRHQTLRALMARCHSTESEAQQIQTDFSEYYKKVPISVLMRDGRNRFDMELNVWDNLSEETKGRQTIVAVHGAPGGSADFKQMALKLANLNYRVVIPDFPGFAGSSLESRDIYNLDNSTDGRADTFDEIMKALDIRKIDVLMCHSAGSWMGYKLCAEDERVKSGVFISPLGVKPHKALRPYKVIQFVNAKLQNPLFHNQIAKFLPRMYEMTGFNIQNLKTSELLAALDTVSTCHLEKVFGYSYKIFRRQLPVLMATSTSDKIVERQIADSMVSLLGGNPSKHAYVFDNDNKPDKNVFSIDSYLAANPEMKGKIGIQEERKPGGIKTSFFKFLIFAKGGHALQHTQSDIISTNVVELLKHLCDKNV